MRHLRRLAVLSLGAVLVVTGAERPARPIHQSDDYEIREELGRRLTDQLMPPTGAIYLSVSRGVVTLRGRVGSVGIKEAAIREASIVPGVVSVVDAMNVERRFDRLIRNDIDDRLHRFVLYSIFDIVVPTVKDGCVTLDGLVTDWAKAPDIADFVSRIDGVVDVSNNLRSIDASRSEVLLQHAIASRLYRMPRFSNQAVLDEPPIHIVVEGGTVFMMGTVNSSLERALIDGILSRLAGGRSLDVRIDVREP